MKKFISWNVNGLRACVTKGFLDYFKEAGADAFCLQETKLQEGQIELDLDGYYQYWNYAEMKSQVRVQSNTVGRLRFFGGGDAREYPGGLLRLDPAFAYAEPPSS